MGGGKSKDKKDSEGQPSTGSDEGTQVAAAGAAPPPEDRPGTADLPPEERYRPGTGEAAGPWTPESGPEGRFPSDPSSEPDGTPATKKPPESGLSGDYTKAANFGEAPKEVKAVGWFKSKTVNLKTTRDASKYSHCDFFARFWEPKDPEEETDVKKMQLHTARCDVRRKLGRTNEAISELREAINIAEQYGESAHGLAHFELGKLLLWADSLAPDREKGALTREALADLEDSKFRLLVEIPNDAMGLERQQALPLPPSPKAMGKAKTGLARSHSWRSGRMGPPSSRAAHSMQNLGTKPFSGLAGQPSSGLPLGVEPLREKEDRSSGASPGTSPGISPAVSPSAAPSQPPVDPRLQGARRRVSLADERRPTPPSPVRRRSSSPRRTSIASDGFEKRVPSSPKEGALGETTSSGRRNSDPTRRGTTGSGEWRQDVAKERASKGTARRRSMAEVLAANNTGLLGEGQNRRAAPPPVVQPIATGEAPDILVEDGEHGCDPVQKALNEWEQPKGKWSALQEKSRHEYLHLKLCQLYETLADTYWTEMRKQDVGSSLRKHYMMQAERSRKGLIDELEVIHGKTNKLIAKQWRCLSDFFTETFEFKEADAAFKRYTELESGNGELSEKAIKNFKGTLKKAQRQDLEERAAVRVQAMFRGWLDRRIVNEMQKDRANLRQNPLAVATVLPFCRDCGTKQGGRYCAGCGTRLVMR